MKPDKLFITIITPTYNAEKTIEKCLASVQSQTFLDYEHIIIDGESKDTTVKMVKEYREKSSKIKLVVENDHGVFDAMNKGIQLSGSEWLYFLGADDFLYDENVLKDVSIKMNNSHAQIVYGDVYFENLQKLYDGIFDIEKILKNNLCHQAIFYQASVFKIIGLYDLRYRRVSDYDFNLKCWLSGKIKQVYVDRTIAYYAYGGISSIGEDPVFFKDYPDVTVNSVLDGKWHLLMKIHLLSKIYRKIVQRYNLKVFVSQFLRTDFFFTRFFAVLWMCLSLPIYILKKSLKQSF